jgi:hypothetical protein
MNYFQISASYVTADEKSGKLARYIRKYHDLKKKLCTVLCKERLERHVTADKGITIFQDKLLHRKHETDAIINF